MTEQLSIGFVGLGNMGLPMSRRLLEAGHEVLGFDVAEAARTAFADAGGTPVAELAGVAAADVLILMLPNSDVVEAVLADPGLSAALRRDHVVVDMSSS